MVFYYANTPLSMAESMAFNNDCLGMVCGFQDGKIVSPGPAVEHEIKYVIPYINFYKTRRELFRDANVLADVAVLRSYPSQVFADDKNAQLTASVEQYCLHQRLPFQIVHDTQLGNLDGYRVLVLAGCVALSDDQISEIRKFVDEGGRLCVIGPVATHNEWMVERKKDAFEGLPDKSITRIAADANIGEALAQSVGPHYSASIDGPEGLYCEYTTVPAGQLVHLVNFRPDRPVKNVHVTMTLPKAKKVSRVRLASPDQKADQTLKFSKKGDQVSFTIPEIGTYGIAIMGLK